ncbi:MAG TPA: cytochrome c-type biogenesis protein [Cellvibrionaceae bacterium]
MKVFSLSLLLLFCTQTLASELYPFDNETDRARFAQFKEELRCPTCQSQNLAGSDSMISESLKREIYEQILDGQSDREITDHLLARYGDYILYRPRLTPATAFLYFAPVVFFVFGVIVLLLVVRKRRLTQAQDAISDTELSAAERKKIQALLESNEGKQQ